MARDWEKTFVEWADAIDDDSKAKGSRTRDEIQAAIQGAPELAGKSISVIVNGSYRNDTNAYPGSDIDIAVILNGIAYNEFPTDGPPTREMLGLRDAEYTFERYRSDLATALRTHFKASNMREGNKAITIKPDSNRLQADVAPFLVYNRYTGRKNADGSWEALKGVEMRPRSAPSTRIINWPEQHNERGKVKNEATHRRFKRIVRILKRLRAEMANGNNDDRSAAGQGRTFVIECLVYNAPDACFNKDWSYTKIVQQVLTWLIDATKPEADASKLVEVSGMKPLFAPSQPWSQAQAQAFLRGAWRQIFA